MLDFIYACINLDPVAIVKTGSYIGIALIVFAESGLLFGIFFPGDSLLFAAGLLSGGGVLALAPLIVSVVLAAIIGDSVGYWFGANVGANFFKRKDSRFFKQEYLRRTERFYQAYGGRAVVLARFVPIVRTIAPILAGIGSMNYRTFLAYNALGGCLWGAGMISLGFFLGSIIPNSETYILPLSLAIVIISFLPLFLNFARGKRAV
ncbi:MAG: Protein DedA (Protein DSG-1) [Parcubacteria group bacterium GW2011_GWB1_57_6]|nr:MAG: Protein DedA (Protein DSG-1) [Parcubacteria group bacterium GW2011_GWA1_56_13]KKW46796.1 MAG: Protein DedA (Protein DSG-1) [Parcubacteria group bacterium GW2011_GWB1_57_6]